MPLCHAVTIQDIITIRARTQNISLLSKLLNIVSHLIWFESKRLTLQFTTRTLTIKMSPSANTRSQKATKSRAKFNRATHSLEKARLEDFHLFPNFPPELRDAIWKMSIVPRVITIKNASQEKVKTRYMGSQTVYRTVVAAETKTPVPAILHACQDSRAIALKAWTLEFEEQLGDPVYFNWKFDTLFMENWDDVLAFYGGPTNVKPYFHFDMEDVEKNLRHLVVAERMPTDFVVKKVVSRLYNLKELFLPLPQGQGFGAIKAAQLVGNKILDWMEQVQEVKSEQDGMSTIWMLPEIEFMSKKQLKNFKSMVSAQAHSILAVSSPNISWQINREFEFRKPVKKSKVMPIDEYDKDDEYDSEEEYKYFYYSNGEQGKTNEELRIEPDFGREALFSAM